MCPHNGTWRAAGWRLEQYVIGLGGVGKKNCKGKGKGKAVLEWPRGFQEVKVPRFRDNGTGWW